MPCRCKLLQMCLTWKEKSANYYHRTQDTLDEYLKGVEEQWCQKILHYPATHGGPILVNHPLVPTLQLKVKSLSG